MHALAQLAAIAIVLFTLPLVIELLLLTAASLLFHAENVTAPAATLRIAVAVAAHNEEQLIARTVTSILAAQPHRLLVIAHNSTDATARIAAESGAEVAPLAGPGGKGHALVHAFTQLSDSADAILVLDADTTIATDLIARCAAALTHADAVQCRYEAAETPGARSQLAALAFRAINVIRPRGRERLGLSCGVLGNGFAFRTSVLDRVPYNAHSIVEDLEFHLALVEAGLRVRYLDHARLSGEIAGSRSQHARWEGGRLQMARAHLPTLLSQILRGRLRLIEPALDLATLPIAPAVFLLLATVLLPVAPLHVYALFALLVIAAHVAAAIAISPHPGAVLFALTQAPMYILRRLTGTASTLRNASGKAQWTRAERDTRPPHNS